jgi:hypothetical protein
MAHLPYEELLRIDVELRRLAKGAAAQRLLLGRALERLSTQGWHSQLGFSSVEGYALERCSRTGAWAQETLLLTRRLRPLPELEAALISGEVKWSTASLLARVATPASEAGLLQQAKRSTVRAMRAQLAQLAAEGRRAGECEAARPEGENAEATDGRCAAGSSGATEAAADGKGEAAEATADANAEAAEGAQAQQAGEHAAATAQAHVAHTDLLLPKIVA